VSGGPGGMEGRGEGAPAMSRRGFCAYTTGRCARPRRSYLSKWSATNRASSGRPSEHTLFFQAPVAVRFERNNKHLTDDHPEFLRSPHDEIPDEKERLVAGATLY